MAGVLALSAVVLLLVAPGGEAVDLFAIAAPIVLITLPGFALVAAFAVLCAASWLRNISTPSSPGSTAYATIATAGSP